jgi:hypothetical protein
MGLGMGVGLRLVSIYFRPVPAYAFQPPLCACSKACWQGTSARAHAELRWTRRIALMRQLKDENESVGRW